MSSPVSDQFQLALDAAPSGMALVDSLGVIRYANANFCELLGYGGGDLLDVNVDEVVPRSIRRQHGELRRKYAESPTVRLMGRGRDLVAETKDGRTVPVEIGLNPVHINGESFVLCSLVDISLRKQAEEYQATAKELDLARRIQQDLLPRTSPVVPGFGLAGRSVPAEATGGDYFDYILRDDGRIVLVIGDVSGHGFGAALLMAVARTYLRALVETHAELPQIMHQLNRYLCQDTHSKFFMTMFVGLLNPETRTLEYAAAGHNGWHFEADGNVAMIEPTGIPMGISETEVIPVGPPILLQPGDMLLLATDGITEANSKLREMFTADRLCQCARENRHRSATEIVDAIHVAVTNFAAGVEPADDMTTLVLRVD